MLEKELKNPREKLKYFELSFTQKDTVKTVLYFQSSNKNV